MSSNSVTSKSSKRVPESVYLNYIKAKVSLLVERHWYPSSLDTGYIERCWTDGKDPDELAMEFFKGIKERI